MVEFLSLFLNLVCCTQQVAVAVDGPVATVEIRLDGTTIATLTSPEWTADCDFGEPLLPHLLEGVARDANGAVLGVASQRLNVPREPAEVRVLLERDEAGSAVAARVAYDSSTARAAKRVVMRMNGLPLAGDESNRFALPEHNPAITHILTAEAVFSGLLSARTQLSFGGRYGSDIRTELTAIPVIADDDDRGDDPGKLAGLLMCNDEPCKTAAVEKQGIRLFMVQQADALPRLQRMARMIDSRSLSGFPSHLVVDEGEYDPADDLLNLVMTRPETTSDGTRQVIILPSLGPLSLQKRSLQWVVAHARATQPATVREHVADAVASAAVSAAASTSPRAVLLVLAASHEDGSLYRAKEIRAYLSAIGVPLFVWSVTGASTAGDWGPCVDVSSVKEISDAADDLLASVRRQRIVWVEGNHLPNDITIREQNSGFKIAGRE